MKRKNSFKITNNMVALLAILFMIVSSMGNYIFYKTSQEVPEKRLIGFATGQMRICINEAPKINNECNNYAYINEQYYCFLNATDREGRNMSYNDTSDLFDISDNGTIEFIPLQENIGSYEINLSVDDNTVCSNAVTKKTINLNIIACTEPTWDNFKNSLTTNLSNFSCWSAVENFTIGIPYKGLVNFTPNTLDINGYNFDKNLNISYNYISVNISALSSLNTSARITLYNLSLGTITIIWNYKVCDNNTCTIIEYNNDNLTFNVSNFYGTYFVVKDVNLSIWDSTDNYIRYANDLVNFYANFTFVTGETVSDGNCKIRFNTTGNYSSFSNMTYNPISELYEYNTTLGIPGIHYWNVLCNISGLTINKTDMVNISNRAPLFYGPMPNETWNEDTILTGRDLDNYFVDPDGENLTFTHTALTHITVTIDPTTYIITLTPDQDWYGNETIIYIATDGGGLSVSSNLIVLIVIDVAEPPPTPAAKMGGAPPPCYEYWTCSDWGACLPTSIQTRTCYDKNNCGSTKDKPDESKECVYIPTCFDNIKNGNEEGVDCGGPCQACPTCYDGIQNQEETDIDCGGPCLRCPTCDDGLRNGNEEGVDCGGPCQACPTCYDGIQNQRETDIDCGGPCPTCPTCYDGIQNQEEEGIDCGGPCSSCVPLFAPTPVRIFFLILIIVVLLIIIYFLLRKKINELFLKTKEKVLLQISKFKKEERIEYKSIEEEVIGKLIDLEESIGKEKTPELFEDLFYIVKGFFTNILKIEYEFTHEELQKELEKQKIRKGIVKEIIGGYKEIEETRFAEKEQTEEKLKEFTKKTIKIVKDIVFLKTVLVEKPLAQFKEFIKKCGEFVKKKDRLNAKISYLKALHVYKELSEKEKAKYYSDIKKLHEKLSGITEHKKGAEKKILTIVLIFATVFFLSFFILPQKTGLVVLESGLILEEISSQTVSVGEIFTYQLEVSRGVGKLTYQDNTNLFNVSNDGLIEFNPTERDTGLKTAVVVVEDETENYDYQLIKFNITEKR